jgi:hypothetical protein
MGPTPIFARALFALEHRRACLALRRLHRPVVQHEQLIRPQWKHCVRSTFVVTELHFVCPLAQMFDDGSNLTAHEALAGLIVEKGNEIEKVNGMGCFHRSLREHNRKRIAE